MRKTSRQTERRDFLCPGNNDAEDIDGGEDRRGRAMSEKDDGGKERKRD